SRGQSVLQRSPHLASKLRGETSPKLLGVARQRKQHGNLAVGNREVDPQRLAATELEQADTQIPCERHRALRECVPRAAVAYGTARVQKGHGNQIIARQPAPDPPQGQDTEPSALLIRGDVVQRLVAEDAL